MKAILAIIALVAVLAFLLPSFLYWGSAIAEIVQELKNNQETKKILEDIEKQKKEKEN